LGDKPEQKTKGAYLSFEDRQDLLGHKSGRITTHYSKPELENLVADANRVCPDEWNKNGTVVLMKEKPPKLQQSK
jgi:hypothetical protein